MYVCLHVCTRERFVFDSFFLEEYRRMVRSKATAKPQSALNNMIAVKRVMRRVGDYSMQCGGEVHGESSSSTFRAGHAHHRTLGVCGDPQNLEEIQAPEELQPQQRPDMASVYG